MEQKLTKRDKYEMLQGIVAEHATEDTKELLLEFLDKQIESIIAKVEKAKEKAAAKKEEGDALREAVEELLTTDLQTIDAIVAQIADEEVTKAKVTARLTALVKCGIATKEDVKDDAGKKVKAYRLADAE